MTPDGLRDRRRARQRKRSEKEAAQALTLALCAAYDSDWKWFVGVPIGVIGSIGLIAVYRLITGYWS